MSIHNRSNVPGSVAVATAPALPGQVGGGASISGSSGGARQPLHVCIGVESRVQAERQILALVQKVPGSLTGRLFSLDVHCCTSLQDWSAAEDS